MSHESEAQIEWEKLGLIDKAIFWCIFAAMCIVGIPAIAFMLVIRICERAIVK